MTSDYNTKTKLLVCYYQPWQIPKENIFFPIQAGKAISKYRLKMQGDDTGDNISEKNSTFSEFTAWYWAWKNIKKIYPNLEYIGLSHYRHFFALSESFTGFPIIQKDIIPNMNNYENIILEIFNKYDIILTKPALYNFNLKVQFELRHNISDYLCMKEILHEKYPEYDDSWTFFFENNNIVSWYCMFISKYNFFNEYFDWLFPLLFEAEKRIDVSKYDSYQKRVIAFLAERLLNVYVYHNKLKVCYEPIYFINGKYKINLKSRIKFFIKIFVPYGILLLYNNLKNRCS